MHQFCEILYGSKNLVTGKPTLTIAFGVLVWTISDGFF